MDLKLPYYAEQLFEPKRYKVLHGGRGGGKSWTVACVLLLLSTQQPLSILCTREVQKSIKYSVRKLLVDTIIRLNLTHFFDILENEIRGKNGTHFTFSGLQEHTIDSIKSFEGVDIVWVEEAHSVSKKSWDILIPTIRKQGSEIWLTLNPDLETDDTYQRFIATPSDDTLLIQVNYNNNPFFPETLDLERQKAERTLPPDEYAHIWLGCPRVVADGAIYKREVIVLHAEKRVCKVPYDAMLPVYTIWDLGWNDAMTIILCQKDTQSIRIIDYIEDTHRTLDYYVGLLNSKPYRYSVDFLPHDGRTRNFQTGKSTEDLLRSMGRSPQVLPALPIEDGIRNARLLFSKCYFDDAKTLRLLECLKRYRRKLDSNGVATSPLHDEYSHGADAFRYLAQATDYMESNHKPYTYKEAPPPDWRL